MQILDASVARQMSTEDLLKWRVLLREKLNVIIDELGRRPGANDRGGTMVVRAGPHMAPPTVIVGEVSDGRRRPAD